VEVLGIGLPELILIVLVLLLLFGASKLPELGRSIGTFGKEVKKGFGEEEEPKKSAKKSSTKK
jgi:TatA/E family protein of Tat protein translocase